MQILAFAASNSRNSINKQLVTHVAAVFQAELLGAADVDLVDLNSFEMPIYSIDRETENGIPREAHDFFERISAVDALFISYAEHNGHYTAAYKNIFDWMSRIDTKVFQSKPMVVMSASPGKAGAANVLKAAIASAPHFGADIRGSFSVSRFYEKFDSDTQSLTDTELAAAMRTALAQLI